ncbi:sel1 repeat family protein [Atlantibacter hermannii]|nr:sel1 repeat family protein [Atlantibacter hermannii]MBL7675775.1 sel1 repeat family protein [Atlantibacter hermannii]
MNTNTAAVDANLAFTCTKEADHVPPLDLQADVLFKQARAMQKAPGAKNYDAIASLYRQAAAKDHYKAMINLQNMLYQGLAKPAYGKAAPEEAVELSERLMKLGVPGGYYSMGLYLETGYGVKRDKAASLSYFRKAADLGSPEGQYVIGKLFMTARFEDASNPDPYKVHFKPNPAYRPEIGRIMLDCAANQGSAEAAYQLALNYQLIQGDYKNAIKYFQLSVQYGNSTVAYKLSQVFERLYPEEKYNLNVIKDPERSRRYKLISDEIDNNPSARFPDIDKIVPLPPAELPKWDGTFEYKKVPQQ